MSSDVLESCLNTVCLHCGHVEYHQYRFRPGFAHTNWRTLRKRGAARAQGPLWSARNLCCFQCFLLTGKTVSGYTHCFAFRYSGSLFPAIARGCWLLVDKAKCFSTKWTVSLKGNSSMCGMCGAELFCTLHTNSWRLFWQVTIIDFCCTVFWRILVPLFCTAGVDNFSFRHAQLGESRRLGNFPGAWLARTDGRR